VLSVSQCSADGQFSTSTVYRTVNSLSLAA
jgi:hypothetical protein